MKRKTVRLSIITGLVILISVICSMQAFAASTLTGTLEPTGATSAFYAYEPGECNRTINVRCVDTNGNLIRQVILYTKYGEENSIQLGIGGYDVIGFTSDQGLLETCKIVWTSGTSRCTEANIHIRYHFRTALSAKTLNVTVTMRPWDPITLVIRHYVQTIDGAGYRSDVLYASETRSVRYYEHISATAKTDLSGYVLREGYRNAISGNFTYDWVGQYRNTPSSPRCYEYDYHHTAWSEDMGEYSDYDESKNGKMDWCDNRVFYIDFYYDLQQYPIVFDANGGSGAPLPVTKHHGMDVALPETVPQRPGYTFLGWGLSQSSDWIWFRPGSTYRADADMTLYAVWQRDPYDFSVSELILSADEVLQYDTVTVRVRTDHLDEKNAHEKIPVQLLYDGVVVGTQDVNFPAGGTAYVTFDLNVGAGTGEHRLEVRINWEDRAEETNTANNSVAALLNVVETDDQVSVRAVAPSDQYGAGCEVITGFLMDNNGASDILPEHRLRADFYVYVYTDVGERLEILAQSRENIVIPSSGTNLIFFRWKVPGELAGKEVYCECIVDPDGTPVETGTADNRAGFTAVIAALPDFQASDTAFELPDRKTSGSVPSDTAGQATWTCWEYENGAFVLMEYGVALSPQAPQIEPGSSCATAVHENGVWNMKSGYGVAVSYAPEVIAVPGYTLPDPEAYTDAQYAEAAFPESDYVSGDGKSCSLEYRNSEFRFPENPDAAGNERIHFVPVYMADGDYMIAVTVTQLWTPVGMISATRISNAIELEGSLYDDWYIH